jgi:hypothetical protein
MSNRTRATIEDAVKPADDAAAGASAIGAEQVWPAPLERTAYHGVVGKIVDAITPQTESDPAAIMLQTLTAAGNAIGRGPHVMVEGTSHHTNLYAIQVGVTGKARKGTSWGRTLQVMAVADPDWKAGCIAHGMSSGEGLIWAVRDPIESIETDKRTGMTSTVVTDAGISDKRVLAIETEFATVLGRAQRDTSSLSAIIRQAWETGDLRTLTKNSPARATGAHISIIAHITSEELERTLDRTEVANGFANRFLFVCVRRARSLPFGGDALDVAALGGELGKAIVRAKRIDRVWWTDGARALWVENYERLSDGASGMFGAVTSRAEAQTLRLALLYAALDGSAYIEREHLQAGLEIWRYCEASARYLFGDAQGDPLADQILDMLRKAPNGMARSEIYDALGRHTARERLGKALSGLQAKGLVTMTKVETAGRPAERWTAMRSEGAKSVKSAKSPPTGAADPLNAHNAHNAQPGYGGDL